MSERPITILLNAPVAEAAVGARVATVPSATLEPPVAEPAPATPIASVPAAASRTSLSMLQPGARAVVRHINAESGFAHRLMELGLIPGTEVALVRHAPLGDPIELVVRGTHFSIRRSEAERIHVDAL